MDSRYIGSRGQDVRLQCFSHSDLILCGMAAQEQGQQEYYKNLEKENQALKIQLINYRGVK